MNLVLEKWNETTTHVLVHVYGNGDQMGTLAFTKQAWAEVMRRMGVEMYVATPLEMTHS